ncbi:uncharacterized protein JCM6883_007627 [Sporobolomyces salmoneus]|uniref:uncharacterized protein n=1 Tax=Sporobolomyces salmoneus TaxID=183962 RepID=UPI0031724614
MSTNESLSNKIGNKTDGAVGEQTLINEASTLASHTLEFGKGLVSKDANSNTTLGDLVNEGRDLSAHVLHTVSDIIGTGVDKTKEAAADAQDSANKDKPVGYVAQARDLAASALSTAESYIATGAKKVDEATSNTTTDDVKNKANQLGNQASDAAKDASNTAQKKADELK